MPFKRLRKFLSQRQESRINEKLDAKRQELKSKGVKGKKLKRRLAEERRKLIEAFELKKAKRAKSMRRVTIAGIIVTILGPGSFLLFKALTPRILKKVSPGISEIKPKGIALVSSEVPKAKGTTVKEWERLVEAAKKDKTAKAKLEKVAKRITRNSRTYRKLFVRLKGPFLEELDLVWKDLAQTISKKRFEQGGIIFKTPEGFEIVFIEDPSDRARSKLVLDVFEKRDFSKWPELKKMKLEYVQSHLELEKGEKRREWLKGIHDSIESVGVRELSRLSDSAFERLYDATKHLLVTDFYSTERILEFLTDPKFFERESNLRLFGWFHTHPDLSKPSKKDLIASKLFPSLLFANDPIKGMDIYSLTGQKSKLEKQYRH